MGAVARGAWWLGVVSLVMGVVSRLAVIPIWGVESHAIVEFAQAALLWSIATSLLGRSAKS